MGKCHDFGASISMIRRLSKFIRLWPNLTAKSALGPHRSSTRAWTPSMVQLGTSVSSGLLLSSISTSTS